MCGRFVSTKKPQELAEHFDVDEIYESDKEFFPNFNVSPQSKIWGVRERDEKRQLTLFHWGLVPSWAKDASIGNRMINARADAVAEKPSYKRAFAKRRVLIPADGFYEWKKEGDKKVPYYFSLTDSEPMAFAGLWEGWKDPNASEDAPVMRSTTIITTDANKTVAPIHNRMPVLIPATHWDEWLDPTNDDVESLKKLLVPTPAEIVQMWRVSRRVNNARTNDAELVEPSSDDLD